MRLYKLFSCNVEIQYRSYFLSKAMFFTLITTLFTLMIPFFITYSSRAVWVKSHYFYEQPIVKFTYQYLIVAETDDPSEVIVCSNYYKDFVHGEENCMKIQVNELDYNDDKKNDNLHFEIDLNVPSNRKISSVTLLLGLDFQLKTECPFHMQSLAIINKDFAALTTGLLYFGDIHLYQTRQLPCLKQQVDANYNFSLFNKDNNENIVDTIVEQYLRRDVNTNVKTIYSRSQFGDIGNFHLKVHLKIQDVFVRYTPNIILELKWVLPQYLSFAFICYWIIYKLKYFVFKNRLLMAWRVEPSKANL